MKIISMTATFGKLEHQTLTLQPGLNVIHAPNEWGKSTWCAFLVSMLYGIDTRERTTQTTIADKERYAPWSGSPMSGQIRIDWNGRDITIERRTKGRAVFGEFSAYETQSGLPVPELNATNCGEVLLGVEKSVFTRSGFIRLTDLPVTYDETLRRRLNALVTTGDESGASDDLAQKLKDLKNRCRHNKTGLLPQAEKERDQLQQNLDTLASLQQQAHDLKQQQATLESQMEALKNHQDALSYADAQANIQRVADANAVWQAIENELTTLTNQCAMLPGKEDAQKQLQQLEQLQEQMAALQSKTIPPQPEKNAVPAPFVGMTPEQALQQANSDFAAFTKLQKPVSPLFLILAAVSLLAVVGFAVAKSLVAIAFGVAAIACVLLHSKNTAAQKRELQAISGRYAGLDPQLWVATATQYQQDTIEFNQKLALHKELYADLENRRTELTEKLATLTEGTPVAQCITYWRKVIAAWEALEMTQSKHTQAKDHAQALAAMVKDVQPPKAADHLTLSKEQTQQQLMDANANHRQLTVRIGQCIGQMETLGQEETLLQQLKAINSRITQLEDTYTALTIAQETLATASNELQRRFAPKISQRAQDIFSRLTNGRYDRLILGQDLDVSAGAADEIGVHSSLWRSEGTADQLYLSLRLAVAEELSPTAPLVLDDALVRFDNQRLAATMDILDEEAKERQIILFTCQGRECNHTAK